LIRPAGAHKDGQSIFHQRKCAEKETKSDSLFLLQCRACTLVQQEQWCGNRKGLSRTKLIYWEHQAFCVNLGRVLLLKAKKDYHIYSTTYVLYTLTLYTLFATVQLSVLSSSPLPKIVASYVCTAAIYFTRENVFINKCYSFNEIPCFLALAIVSYYLIA